MPLFPLVRPRLLPPKIPRRSLQLHTTDSGGPAGGFFTGNGGTTPPARPRAPEGRPGALRGHRPRTKAKQRPHAQTRGEARATRRQDAPFSRRGRGARPQNTQAEKGKRRVSAASEKTAGAKSTEVGPGSAPLSFYTPPSGGGERRGARGQSEKSGPIRQGMSVPRLARLRPGPGERDVTTSIGSGGASRKARAGKAGRGTGQRGGGPGPHRSRRRRETRRGQPAHTQNGPARFKSLAT